MTCFTCTHNLYCCYLACYFTNRTSNLYLQLATFAQPISHPFTLSRCSLFHGLQTYDLRQYRMATYLEQTVFFSWRAWSAFSTFSIFSLSSSERKLRSISGLLPTSAISSSDATESRNKQVWQGELPIKFIWSHIRITLTPRCWGLAFYRVVVVT